MSIAAVISFTAAIALPVLLLTGLFATAFSGRTLATATLADDQLTITLLGLMPIYALRRRLRIPLAAIRTARADRSVRNLIGGTRIGTHFPRVMTAGIFLRGGGRRDFFAIGRAGEALVLDLRTKVEGFTRVIVEVPAVDATVAAIEAAR